MDITKKGHKELYKELPITFFLQIYTTNRNIVWFASLFSNEALISISAVQLLHFSHLGFASTNPSLGLPA